MTAPDPRLGEIEGRLAKVARIQTQGGKYADLDAAVYRSQSDVPYLLAELRKAQDALGRVEGLAADWDAVHEMFPGTAGGVLAKAHANQLRAAVAAATGGERG